MKHFLLASLLLLWVGASHQQQQILAPEKLVVQNPCVSKQTCGDCIQTPTCAWCSQPNFGNGTNVKRCFQPEGSDRSKFQCKREFIVNPDNVYTVLMSKELSKAKEGSESVQVHPQRVSLKLRIAEAYRFTMDYAQAEDYPVDLYYLMDLSKSMEDDKDKLSELGDLLAEAMQNITSNFRLGFGSFVDKVVMPYVSTVPKNLEQPCTGCAAPYGYHNVMSLSQDTGRFAGEVKKAAVSGNLDAPEGGFDAIMQAVVCRDQIGWREKARRLLVFSTDAGFHYAGDGKLGGIVKPNDGECHLDQAGMYTHSTLQDYPSISQVNLKVKQNAINVIFAVTANQINIYDKLKDNIEGASSGTLSDDSANVVELVREQYGKISSSVEIKDNATSAVKVTYYSSCLTPGPLKQTNKCDGLKVGTKVSFVIEIEVTSCPKDRKEWNQILQVYPVGINESLIVDLEMLCDCPCENPGNPGYKQNAKECSYSGTYKCGVCECDDSHFGRKCECNSENAHGTKDLTSSCRPDNYTTVDCSGRGSCVCGVCECEARQNPEESISGPFCECDNFSCDRHNGLLCSGPDHGTCVCGSCQCNAGWTGKSCDCKISQDTCIPPGGGEICSGKGSCECGVCKCFEDAEKGRYFGRYCEKCNTCTGRCNEFKECVQCQVYKTGSFDEEACRQNCTTFVPSVVDEVTANEEEDEYLCRFYDEDDCRFAYVYSWDEAGKIVVRAQEHRDCPPQIYILGIVLGVIGAIVLIGLALLLLWKLLTTIHDRREFAKFENERMMAKWDTGENPIYKQATSTFKNPTYAGK
ncbi:integrin beta-PS isoform X2 [Neocloeon triangulifer]|uniref:integrin beta-PS isoform X2 n=1 Tax=Neocloeon triangulifer TaxID=2078957 RepID=UPI00286F1723|nr:integrin beta-PS isoform X2 [Neocloeon triangulifer]